MAKSRVVMDKLEHELDAMHSAENGGVADNEAIEQDIATMLSERNHLGAIDPFNNEEDNQQQPELAHVHTQEQQHAHMQDHELDGAAGERHDNSTSYWQQQERVIKPPIFSNTKGRKSKMQAAKSATTAAKKPPRPIKRVEFGPDGKPLGIRACRFCNIVSNHNYRTCPLRTDATVNKQTLHKQIGAAQVSTNGDNIRGDKRMLDKSGLEINPNNFIDMQRKWKDPTTNKYYDSLADVAGGVIHPSYKGMKKKIEKKEEHKLWGTSPLPDKLIEYAGIDAYATYKSCKTIDNIVTGRDISKEQEADPYFHCNFAG
ncbi:hypothetical protein CFC21_099108 [Triticum aestivum]|uniref:Uncharacterized protein n=2 Tax=Triticum aestivum TaxID=4565 RepID=A0A9R1LYE8_WHEAT|nr:hypothetical protein CFC21_099108 [Triticum aestivum]